MASSINVNAQTFNASQDSAAAASRLRIDSIDSIHSMSAASSTASPVTATSSATSSPSAVVLPSLTNQLLYLSDAEMAQLALAAARASVNAPSTTTTPSSPPPPQTTAPPALPFHLDDEYNKLQIAATVAHQNTIPSFDIFPLRESLFYEPTALSAPLSPTSPTSPTSPSFDMMSGFAHSSTTATTALHESALWDHHGVHSHQTHNHHHLPIPQHHHQQQQQQQDSPLMYDSSSLSMQAVSPTSPTLPQLSMLRLPGHNNKGLHGHHHQRLT
ncbi:hypothetical protein HK102_009179, partial [Quaeritorhiza haematococci]